MPTASWPRRWRLARELVQPAGKVVWGGYRGYFADPDGFLWEVCWNPFFPLDEQGHVRLPA